MLALKFFDFKEDKLIAEEKQLRELFKRKPRSHFQREGAIFSGLSAQEQEELLSLSRGVLL